MEMLWGLLEKDFANCMLRYCLLWNDLSGLSSGRPAHIFHDMHYESTHWFAVQHPKSPKLVLHGWGPGQATGTLPPPGGIPSSPGEIHWAKPLLGTSCLRAGSDWVQGRNFLPWGWWGPGPGCPERWSMPHPWEHSRPGWTGLWATRSGWRCPCSLQGGWARWPSKVPSSPNHPMILWFYDQESERAEQQRELSLGDRHDNILLYRFHN